MTTAAKLWLGFGGLTALVVLTNAAIILRVRTIDNEIDAMSNVALPRYTAARQMEIGTLGYALAVRTFGQTGDSKFRDEAREKAARVDTHLAEYESLVTSERQAELASGFAGRWRRFREIGETFLDGGGAQPSGAEWLLMSEQRLELERFLDTQMQIDAIEMYNAGNHAAVQDLRTAQRFALVLVIMGALIASVTSVVVGRGVIKSETEIRSGRERLRATLASIGDAVITTGPDGRITSLNTVAESLTGWTDADAVGKPLDQVFHIVNEKTGVRVESPAIQALRKGSIVTLTDQTVLISRSGTETPIDDSAAPIRDSQGEIAGCVLVFRDITERKGAEEALRESEERRKLAQDAGNVGIFDWNIATGKTYWSETMWKFYGDERRDINPNEAFWSSHLHGNDRERVKTNIRHVLASGADEFRDEFRIVRNDGSILWIDAVARVVRAESGTATRMYGVNLDITTRKDAEEKIRISENQLRLVTDTLPALISYVDSSRRYRFVNQKYSEWFGVQKDEVVGKKVREVIGLPAFRIVMPNMDKALAGEEVTFETRLDYKNAGSRYVRISYMPDFGLDDRVNGFYVLVSDMTDLKRSQDLLRASEDRIGLMMENLSDYAIFGMDDEGRIESWNKGAEKIFGYTTDEILGRSCELLFTAEDVERGVPADAMSTAREKGKASDDRWHLKKDGTRFFANGIMMPLYVGDALTGYAMISSDLTEKKRHADDLQRAHDELEIRVQERTRELAASNRALLEEMEEREIAERQRIDLLRRLVSSQEFERRRIARDLHDQLGQRLTALRLKIASLKEACAEHEQFAARVQRLQEIAERLDSEVSFLAWELRPSALDDLGLVDSIGAFVSEWSRHYEIAADFHSAKLSKVRLYPETETHLYRITQEALNNIAKHAKAGHVTVQLEKREQNVILIVEDDGKGFDPAEETVQSESGKGLGLVGMSERASLVGGEVEIESAPGKGTTIYVRVPFST